MVLFANRRFLPLFITQFMGAFNDNLLKNALVILITYRLASEVENPQALVTLASAVYILPFFLFSATAGELADKYDRARLTRYIKIFEIMLAVIATAGFMMQHVTLLFFALFCMGSHSAFFSPVKYALLPQHLRDDELLSGNGYMESGAFLAILLGAIVGGLLILQPSGALMVGGLLGAVAVIGYTGSRFIPAAPPPSPSLSLTRNIVRATRDVMRHGRQDRRIFFCILGTSWFYLMGSVFLAQFPNYTRLTLGGDETVVTLLLAAFSIGIAIGSAACGKLLGGNITARYVPVALLVMAAAIADLYITSLGIPAAGDSLLTASEFLRQPHGPRIAADLLVIAISGGIYVVPLYTIIQHCSEAAHRARVIASNNIMNALFMAVAALGSLLLLKAGLSVPEIFLVMGILNSFLVVFTFKLISRKSVY